MNFTPHDDDVNLLSNNWMSWVEVQNVILALPLEDWACAPSSCDSSFLHIYRFHSQFSANYVHQCLHWKNL